MTSPALLLSPAATACTACTSSTVPSAFTVAEIPTTTTAANQYTIGAGPTVGLGTIRVEPPRGLPVRRHRVRQPKNRQQSALPNGQLPNQQHRPQPKPWSNHDPTPQNSEAVVQPPPCLHPVQWQWDVPPSYYCEGQHHLRKCRDLCTAVENGILSINNRNRLVLGPAGGEISLALAHCDYRTIRDYAHAGAPILLVPPPPPSPARSNLPLPPQPSACSSPPPPPARLVSPARPVSPAPSPARLTPISTPLLSPEKLTQLMGEVMEHFAQSWQVKVDLQPRPRYTARPPLTIQLVHMREQSFSERHPLGKA